MKNIIIPLALTLPIFLNAQTLNIDQSSTYAVVVGISDYQDSGIPDLRFADKDAEAFAGFLQSPAGGVLDEDHLKVLINQQATMAQFAIALDWLWEVVQENDKVIIYFSGHGDVERKSLTQPGFLLCWDAPARVYLAGGTLALPMFQEVISTLSVQNKAKVIVITDACRSGKLSGSLVGGAQITGSNLAKQYANEIKILSCQPDEYSIEGEQWGGGRGAFSYHLIDGLYGMADGDSDMNVNLKEIGRYLDDHVSGEVAPQSQNPMTIGSKTEKLTKVFPELLAQLKDGRKGQMQLFNTTESRGIEDDVLAEADSNIVEIYLAFKQSLKDQQFLEPGLACADFYYEQLSQEPQLERLHSSMRRNYAAALQDDAQQVMNTMLKSGLTEQVLKHAKAEDIYKNYPAYLERAAELLGEEHYMYIPLQARKLFFEGKIQNKRADRRLFYGKALSLQPDMPQAIVELISDSEADQLDTAMYYFQQVTTIVPSWVQPYIAMAYFYNFRLKNIEKAEEMLIEAGQVDSTSILVWYRKGSFYNDQKKYALAEKWYLKTIEASGEDICFSCAYQNLGLLYINTRRYDEAEKYLKEAIQLDSTLEYAYQNLGLLCVNTRRYDEAEKYLKKAIQLDSTLANAYINLGNVYYYTRRYDEAEKYYLKAIQLDSTNEHAYYNVGLINKKIRGYDEAEKHLKKAIQLDSTFVKAYNALGLFYMDTRRYEEAEQVFKKAIQLDSTSANLYNNLGNVYKDTRRYDEAEKYLKKAIQMDSTFWISSANLGILYQKFQRWEESEVMAQKSIAFGPPIGLLVAILGNAYTHLPARFEEAAPTLHKALEMDPEYPDTYIYLAQLALKNNNAEEAWQFFEQGLEKGIGNGELTIEDLQSEPDFEGMRKEAKWGELIKKYFPEKVKE